MRLLANTHKEVNNDGRRDRRLDTSRAVTPGIIHQLPLWAEAGKCPNGGKLQGHLPTPVAVLAADNRKSTLSASYTRSRRSGYLAFPGSPGVPKKQSATIAQRTASSSALLFSNGGNPRSRQRWRCYAGVGHSGPADP